MKRVGGNCQSGYDWSITFTGVPGDLDLLDVSGSDIDFDGGDVVIKAETIEDGGLIMGGIPADYMYVRETSPQVHVQVNKGSAVCEKGRTSCGFTFDESLSPSIIDITSEPNAESNGATITVTGTNLDSPIGAIPLVSAGEVSCKVIYFDETSVTCSFNTCMEAGLHKIIVVVQGRGRAAAELEFAMPLWVSSVTPSLIHKDSPTEISLTGRGFNTSVHAASLLIGGSPCPTVSATCTELVCLYTPPTSGRRNAGPLLISYGGSGIGSITAGVLQIPKVTKIEPTEGPAGSETLVTITGQFFSDEVDGNVISIGGVPCKVQDATSTHILCSTQALAPGPKNVIISNVNGSSVEDVSYVSVLHVDSITASQNAGLGGGLTISLQGQGFLYPDHNASLSIDFFGQEIYVIGAYRKSGFNISGTFSLRIGDLISAQLHPTSTSVEIKAAIEQAFLPLGIKELRVTSIDNEPGKLADRLYPRQWIISWQRPDILGSSLERCTDPNYVDWDPSACPTTASDLFLSFHKYYWPVLLSRPDDLGSELAQQRYLAECKAEAISLGFIPAAKCNALVPEETLPLCGQGSGKNPPCFNERFSTATVQHLDGTAVTYFRDDTMTPGYQSKG